MATQYFKSSRTGGLYRRDKTGDNQYARVSDSWVPTETIMKAMVGRDDDVDQISEADAQKEWPAAFAS